MDTVQRNRQCSQQERGAAHTDHDKTKSQGWVRWIKMALGQNGNRVRDLDLVWLRICKL